MAKAPLREPASSERYVCAYGWVLRVRKAYTRPTRSHSFARVCALRIYLSRIGAQMTGKATTPEPAIEAPASYGELFLAAPDADTSGQRQTLPDESEAAMERLRTPFDLGPINVAKTRG
ncbi:hypothetical protein GCM10022251_53580 [Phytohabitans flavus]|uniref:Uncharacterized protein n=1 Tax=Phytohabitans flavus TaxID=1076124 RepID=A0A6F8XLX8_9ACTN|nr:hypothetical protein Pflav_012320 [Phytohabitans flavus]